MATTMVHVRISEKTKAQATKALTAMGLSIPEPLGSRLMSQIAISKIDPKTP